MKNKNLTSLMKNSSVVDHPYHYPSGIRQGALVVRRIGRGNKTLTPDASNIGEKTN